MRQLIGNILRKLCLEDAVKKFFHTLVLSLRKLTLVDRRIRANYFRDQPVRKLHLGCGKNILQDWLNSDYSVNSGRVLFLDATGKFPFKDNSFSYVYSEHMIEHIPFAQGQNMLRECYRILAENGTIRISTPDLSFLLDLHNGERTNLQKEYIKWTIDTIVKDAPAYHAAFVINNFMRDWEHVFIYDETTLRGSLEKAGFEEIVRCELNTSDHTVLRDLENAQRLPEGFLGLETMTFEAKKVSAD